jgi:undecaprenyl diphosphate synthase
MNNATPQHIAFIMDGNGRWAKSRGLPRLEGHRRGVETVRTMCGEALKLGIPYLTFYAFSTENWQRPMEEVSGLFELMYQYFKREMDKLNAKGIRVQFIGDHSAAGKLPEKIRNLIQDVEDKTAKNTNLTAVFAVNYSGQDELVRATRCMLAAGLKAQEVDSTVMESYLDTRGIPVPDLLIRTSGEQRLSNFMLWQLAYSEFYFTEIHWPAFDEAVLQTALTAYASRNRRFGGLESEQ